MELVRLLVLLLLQASVIQSARICVYSVIAFRNHRSGYDSLLEELTAKGHNVTLFSTLPLSEKGLPNVQHFRPKPVVDYIEAFFKGISPLEWRSKGKQHVIWDMLPILGIDICNIVLGNRETQEWLRTAQFDLFIVDSLWNECGIGLAHVFRAKHVISNFNNNLLLWNPDDFGSVWETSWIPDPQYDTSFPVSFTKRLRGVLRTIRWNIYRSAFSYYQMGKLFRKHLKIHDFPPFHELQVNTSLVLVNSHFSEEYARSIPPMVVPVGGVHIKENGRLNSYKKIEKFLIDSAQGFILVNIGCTSDTARNLSIDTWRKIVKSLRASSFIKFILMLESSFHVERDDKLFSDSSNVLFVKECLSATSPLLAHPNIKGLITHGDVLDVHEAIYYAVPLIVLPVVFDQDSNAERISRLGRGIRMEILSLVEEDLTVAINQLITNDKYKTNMKKASTQFRDRQVKPLETAVWWIEYVLRSSDLSALKPLGIYQPWYIRRSLDVWLLIFCITFPIFIILLVAVAVLFKTHSKSKLFGKAGTKHD